MKTRKKDPAASPRRDATRRHEIIALLASGTFSAMEISGRLGMPVKEVCHHLEHIARTLRRGPGRLVTIPAACRLCGYTFRKRERYTTPGRCPACRKGSLDPPLFSVQGQEG